MHLFRKCVADPLQSGGGQSPPAQVDYVEFWRVKLQLAASPIDLYSSNTGPHPDDLLKTRAVRLTRYDSGDRGGPHNRHSGDHPRR